MRGRGCRPSPQPRRPSPPQRSPFFVPLSNWGSQPIAIEPAGFAESWLGGLSGALCQSRRSLLLQTKTAALATGLRSPRPPRVLRGSGPLTTGQQRDLPPPLLAAGEGGSLGKGGERGGRGGEREAGGSWKSAEIDTSLRPYSRAWLAGAKGTFPASAFFTPPPPLPGGSARSHTRPPSPGAAVLLEGVKKPARSPAPAAPGGAWPRPRQEAVGGGWASQSLLKWNLAGPAAPRRARGCDLPEPPAAAACAARGCQPGTAGRAAAGCPHGAEPSRTQPSRVGGDRGPSGSPRCPPRSGSAPAVIVARCPLLSPPPAERIHLETEIFPVLSASSHPPSPFCLGVLFCFQTGVFENTPKMAIFRENWGKWLFCRKVSF